MQCALLATETCMMPPGPLPATIKGKMVRRMPDMRRPIGSRPGGPAGLRVLQAVTALAGAHAPCPGHVLASRAPSSPLPAPAGRPPRRKARPGPRRPECARPARRRRTRYIQWRQSATSRCLPLRARPRTGFPPPDPIRRPGALFAPRGYSTASRHERWPARRRVVSEETEL